MVTSNNRVGPKVVVAQARSRVVTDWARASTPPGSRLVELDTSPSAFPVPWRGARGLLAELARRRGARATEDAIEPHRTHLSTVLRPLQATLTAREHERRLEHSGAQLGRLPSANSIAVGVIGEAFAAALASLLSSAPTRVLVANGAELDSESWGILSPLLQRHPAITLIVGWEPGYAPPSPIQARVAEVGAWELSVLASRRHVVVEHLVLDHANVEPALPTVQAEPPHGEPLLLDDDLEARAHALLGRDGPLPREARELVDAAIHGAFDALGFPAVLSLTQQLLARADELDEATQAECRLLAGICAHNLCAFARRAAAGHPLYALGDEQLDRALPLLPRAEDRVLVCYRRGMRLAGSREGLVAAEQMLSRAVEEARRLPERHVLHRVYANNGLAYVKYRLGDRAAAREHCEVALRVAEASHPEAPTSEVGSAGFNVLVNLARLTFLEGDLGLSEQRLRQALHRLDTIEHRKPFFSWFSTQVFIRDMAAAVAELEQRIDALDPHWVETMMAGYAFWAGDLHYRLGDAERAFQRFCLAVELWSHFHEDPLDVLYAHLNCAAAAYRAGRLDEAWSRFSAVKAVLPPDALDLHAEILGALALLAARRADEPGARTAIAAALEALGPVDDLETRARVHRMVGDAHLALGDRAAAHHAFLAGLAPAMSPAGASGVLVADALPAEVVFGLLLGLVELDAATTEHVRLACELGPRALLDSDAWWDAPRLARVLADPRWRGATTCSPERDRLLALMRQRPDCATLVEATSESHRS